MVLFHILQWCNIKHEICPKLEALARYVKFSMNNSVTNWKYLFCRYQAKRPTHISMNNAFQIHRTSRKHVQNSNPLDFWEARLKFKSIRPLGSTSKFKSTDLQKARPNSNLSDLQGAHPNFKLLNLQEARPNFKSIGPLESTSKFKSIRPLGSTSKLQIHRTSRKHVQFQIYQTSGSTSKLQTIGPKEACPKSNHWTSGKHVQNPIPSDLQEARPKSNSIGPLEVCSNFKPSDLWEARLKLQIHWTSGKHVQNLRSRLKSLFCRDHQ